MTEAEIQRSIVEWLGYVLPRGSLVHHSPNEGRHKVQWRVAQKRLGVLAGWPDLEIFCHPAGWIGAGGWRPIFLEVKAPHGSVRQTQRDMIERLRAVGCHAEIVRSIDESRDVLAQWIRLSHG